MAHGTVSYQWTDNRGKVHTLNEPTVEFNSIHDKHLQGLEDGIHYYISSQSKKTKTAKKLIVEGYYNQPGKALHERLAELKIIILGNTYSPYSNTYVRVNGPNYPVKHALNSNEIHRLIDWAKISEPEEAKRRAAVAKDNKKNSVIEFKKRIDRALYIPQLWPVLGL